MFIVLSIIYKITKKNIIVKMVVILTFYIDIIDIISCIKNFPENVKIFFAYLHIT